MMLFNRKLFIGIAILAICALSAPAAFAYVPGGTQDPTAIPKYVTPLPGWSSLPLPNVSVYGQLGGVV